MANDITKVKSANDIKNGTTVVGCKPTGFSNKDILNTYVLNTPTLNDIQSKFDARFDDPSYYYGIGNDIVVGG